MNHIVCDMFLESEKKNSVRYDAADQSGNAALTAVYISKKAYLSPPYPEKIRITITERD